MNLGLSEKFGVVDYDKLIYPAIMTVDYIRVYQDPDLPNVTCDPRKRMTLCFGYFTILTHPLTQPTSPLKPTLKRVSWFLSFHETKHS